MMTPKTRSRVFGQNPAYRPACFFMRRSSRPSRPLPLVVLASFILLGVVAAAIGVTVLISRLTQSQGPSQVNVLELWNSGSYDEILASAKTELDHAPLNSEALIFSGFAAFHKGVAEVTVEKKLPLINQSISMLRKALLLPHPPLEPEIHYILGKAYFHKGKFFADQAIEHLLKARELRYDASDMNEYLGLSYSLVSRYSEAADYFLKAVEKTPTDLLLWTLGQTYYQLQRYDDAVKYLNEAIDKTKDRSLEQRCRFLLGDIYTKTKEYDAAQQQYLMILDKNANSADAHFYLGEIALAQGNKDAARVEWRKAFKIDPLHFNANQRLFN